MLPEHLGFGFCFFYSPDYFHVENYWKKEKILIPLPPLKKLSSQPKSVIQGIWHLSLHLGLALQDLGKSARATTLNTWRRGGRGGWGRRAVPRVAPPLHAYRRAVRALTSLLSGPRHMGGRMR